MNLKSEKYYQEKTQDLNDEVDLRIIYRIIIRKKLFLLIFILLGTFSSAIYSLQKSPTYKGGFQIFLKSEKTEKFSNPNNLTSLIKSKLNTDLNTQVEILKSPLVLKPVFEYVKNYKKTDNDDSLKKMNYQSWINSSLEIELIKGTTILNVSYKNQDKDLILSSLKIISDKYKAFSKRDEIESLKRGEFFLKNQINIKKDKQTQLVNDLNDYMIENNLGKLGLNGFLTDFNLDKSFDDMNSIDTTNNIDSNQKNLVTLEAQCQELSFKLKPESKFLTLCKEKIAYKKKLLRRPNEILVKYSSMMRDLNSNEKILINLENDLAILQLQKAKKIEPWELISDPYVEDLRISPNRKRITLFGSLLSFLFGIILILLQNRLGLYIYELHEAKKIIPFKYLGTLFSKNNNLSNKKFDFFLNNEFPENDKSDLACFINEQDVRISKLLEKFNIKQFHDINELDKFKQKDPKKLVLFFEQGKINKNHINLIFEYLRVSQNEVIGWFFIDNEQEYY